MASTADPDARPDLDAAIAAARTVLDEHGLRECDCGATVGFVLRIEGRDEFSPELCEPGDGHAIAAFAQCCAKLVDRGHSVTFIASPRVLALYVRHD